jgi:hypothetical protein
VEVWCGRRKCLAGNLCRREVASKKVRGIEIGGHELPRKKEVIGSRRSLITLGCGLCGLRAMAVDKWRRVRVRGWQCNAAVLDPQGVCYNARGVQ